MKEHDVIRTLGRFPDKILPNGGGMVARVWKCSMCGIMVFDDEPFRNPAPCAECSGIAFEVIEK